MMRQRTLLAIHVAEGRLVGAIRNAGDVTCFSLEDTPVGSSPSEGHPYDLVGACGCDEPGNAQVDGKLVSTCHLKNCT